MALWARLCCRNVNVLHGVRSISVTPCCMKVTLQPQTYQPPKVETHDEKNMRLCRPQSPHLTIYKFQLPANLSITHRFTGMALSGYIAGIGITSLLINRPMVDLITNFSTSYPICFLILKFGLVFPFTYHFFNGIRHLVWDAGKALTLKGVYITGYAMLITSVITGAGLIYYQEIEKEREALAEKLKREAEEAARALAEQERERLEQEKTKGKGKKK